VNDRKSKSISEIMRLEIETDRLARRTLLQRAAFLGLGSAGISQLSATRGVAARQSDEPSEWVVGLSQEPETIDPTFGATTSPANVPAQVLLLNPLVEFVALRNGPEYELEYHLAESHRVVDDTTWEFTLRPGVTFHNGDPFTAEDVVYSVDAHLAPESPWAWLNDSIEGVEIVDPSTVRFHTKGLQASFLVNLSFIRMFPQTYREELGAEAFNQNPVGTGPYTFVEWVPGERIVVQADPNFWGGEVFPRRIALRFIPDPTTRVSELRAGGLDIIQSPPVASLGEIANDPALDLLELRGARTIQYKINASQPPFDDVRVRQAVNYAVDREAIINGVLEGHAVPLVGTFSEGWLGWDADLAPYPYDPERARELLAEAGYGDGFATDFNTTSGVYLNDIQVAEAVAAYLAELGITVTIIPSEPTKLLQDQAAGNFAGFLITPWGSIPDPNQMLMIQFYDEPAHPPEQFPELNALIEASQSTLDPAEREAALQELNRYIHEQALNLEIHSQSEFWAKRKEIDWEPFPIRSHVYVLLWRPAD
jgi:peptide/nickel transport system substrate-binding protein